ncbi:MAG: hypothetical protein DSZ29_00595 [Aquificaceae bacterium]|nr:MAG: hypothetical protein DSZ29_00595 [Aquificaceae bacterium]
MKPNKLIILLALLCIFLALGSTYYIAKQSAETKLQQRVKSQLSQVVNELKITLERHSYLPEILSFDTKIIDFLSHLDDDDMPKKQRKINLALEYANNISESAAIYVMRPDGVVVASSNWESKYSFIGKNLAFRPYFQQAMQNTLGRYYAVGAISGTRGYFFASSIVVDNKVIGVVAVKVAIDDIEFTWGQGAVDFMVTDANGVIFLSSQKNWNLKSVLPLSELGKRQVENSLRYGDNLISRLENTDLNIADNHFQRITLLGKEYEMLSHKMALADWDVRVVASYAGVKKRVLNTMLMSALILLLLSALALLLWRAQQQRKKYQQQITEELERKVAQRTQALKQSQEELIQAAKMAALGQLSAGMAHEINNPLTAIRAYADNARQFLQKDRLDMVASNLAEISTLTETMASITQQLKSFSRKSKGQMTPVVVGRAINHALAIVHPQMTRHKVSCHWDERQQGVNKKVLADELWLGQILVNLLTNAISATKNKVSRTIWISIRIKSGSQLCIRVKDNGMGIEDDNLSHIFEPFFTTKVSTKGLGLGLSISFNLAKDMQGSLKARNHKQGGAVFSLCLPMVKNT